MTKTTRKGGIPVGDRHAPRQRGGATSATAAEPTRAGAARSRALPSWLPTGSLGLSLLGLAVSAYLTYEHLTQGTTLACPEGQVLNCQKVTQSEYSALLGVPVAPLGALFFAAMVALCLPAAWRRRPLDLVRLAATGVGVAMVAYLVWAEVQLGAICLWCTVVHVVTVVLLLLLVFGRALTPRDG